MGNTVKVQRIRDPKNQVIKEGKMPKYNVSIFLLIIYIALLLNMNISEGCLLTAYIFSREPLKIT